MIGLKENAHVYKENCYFYALHVEQITKKKTVLGPLNQMSVFVRVQSKNIIYLRGKKCMTRQRKSGQKLG